MELIQNDKELQADLAYLVGTGRLRTSCSVYGSAVEDGKAEKIRSAINIEKWEMLEEQEDEDDNILDFLHKSGSEKPPASSRTCQKFPDYPVCGYDVRGSIRFLQRKPEASG